jgi:hypothetical protein
MRGGRSNSGSAQFIPDELREVFLATEGQSKVVPKVQYIGSTMKASPPILQFLK